MKNGTGRTMGPWGGVTRAALSIVLAVIVVATGLRPFSATAPEYPVSLSSGALSAISQSRAATGTLQGATAATSAGLAKPTTRKTASTPGLAAPASLRVKRFAPIYMAHKQTYTLTRALAMARNFDLIVVHTGDLTKYVAAMKAVNPNLQLLVYVNSTFAPLGSYNPSWYARDMSGNLINAIPFPATYLMDVSNPAWPPAATKRCADGLAASGYDGCFLDVLGPAGVNLAYVSSLPVNPMTGKVWTTADYVAQASLIPEQVSASLPGVPLLANGLVSGYSYFDPSSGPTSMMLPYVKSAMAECWIRARSMPFTQFRPVAKWLDDVNMIVDAESHGYTLAVTVKVWGGATRAEISNWHVYSLASFLLATSGRSYYSFSTGTLPGDVAAGSAMERVDLGAPLGPYSLLSGVYARQFSAGMVLVNPSPTTVVTISLGASYKMVPGGTVVTKVHLKPDSASILTLVP